MLIMGDYLVGLLGALLLVSPTVSFPIAECDWLWDTWGVATVLGLAWSMVVWMRRQLQLRAAERAVRQAGGTLPGGPEAEEANWRCGRTFHYNPDDPALLVQYPGGTRYTLNCARPAAWFYMALVGISTAAFLGAIIVDMRAL